MTFNKAKLLRMILVRYPKWITWPHARAVLVKIVAVAPDTREYRDEEYYKAAPGNIEVTDGVYMNFDFMS